MYTRLVNGLNVFRISEFVFEQFSGSNFFHIGRAPRNSPEKKIFQSVSRKQVYLYDSRYRELTMSRISAPKSREKAGKRDGLLGASADDRWNASIPRETESFPRLLVKSDTFLEVRVSRAFASKSEIARFSLARIRHCA